MRISCAWWVGNILLLLVVLIGGMLSGPGSAQGAPATIEAVVSEPLIADCCSHAAAGEVALECASDCSWAAAGNAVEISHYVAANSVGAASPSLRFYPGGLKRPPKL